MRDIRVRMVATIGDIDGDGDLDAIVGSNSQGDLQNFDGVLYLNNGSGFDAFGLFSIATVITKMRMDVAISSVE